jgi:hypothetical protein
MPSAPESEQIVVTCIGRTWVLPARNAWDWILAVFDDDDLSRVFPGMIDDEDVEEMFEAWMVVPDMARRCTNVARVALGRASGREWWWAVNMIKEVLKSWTLINGALVRHGVRAGSTSLADWLDAAYTQLREMVDDKERSALEMRLRIPPRNVTTITSSREALLAFAAD